jgi:hypothetical protein
MAKATLNLPDGTVVTVEGSPDEIARITSLHSQSVGGNAAPPRRKTSTPKKRSPKAAAGERRNKEGPQSQILELKAEDFFKEKRSLRDVQRKLEEMGHIYSLNNITSPLIRLVRNKTFRRIKDEGVWYYVNK